MRAVRGAVSMLVLAGLVGCTSFVKPVPGAMAVSVVKPEHVATCEKLGQTNTRTAAKVAFIRRKSADVQAELEMLARNDAVTMGGDTVVAQGQPREGQLRFTIYRCR